MKELLRPTTADAQFNPVCELYVLGVCGFVCSRCSQSDVNDVLIFRAGKWPHIGLCAQRDSEQGKTALKGRREL